MKRLRIGVVPVVRPLFRGSRLGLDARSQAELAQLGDSLGFEIVLAPPPLSTLEEAQAVARAAQAANLDLLILEHVTFSTGEVFLPLLDLPIPVALWALPEVWETGPLPQNALCGMNLGISLADRRTLPVKWLYGWPQDELFRGRLEPTLQALRARRALTQGRVLRLGGHAPGFFAFDPLPQTGLNVEDEPLDRLWEALAAVTPQQIAERAATLAEMVEFDPASLEPSFRLEVALEQVAAGYDGVALREWPEIPDRLGVMAYAAMARLADRGVVLAPEGDFLGLASQLALQAISGQYAVLLDVVHLSSKGVMLWHGGEAPLVWAGGPSRLVQHFNRVMPAVRDMPLRAGVVSGFRLLPNQQVVINGGRLTGEKGYDGDSGWLVEPSWAGHAQTPQQFLTSWLNYRVPHHLPLALGNHQEALAELAAWLGYQVLPPAAQPHTLLWPS